MKKNIIVAKFGGVSVQTSHSIENIYNIINNNKNIKIIVISAVGNTTNLLLSLCHNNIDKQEKKKIINEILQIHNNLSEKLGLNLNNQIESRLNKTSKLIINSKRFSKKKIDEILSTGEDLSSLIIHEYLLIKNINTKLLDSRNYIITDNNFGSAIPNIKTIKEKFLLLSNKICIMQGFIGSTTNNLTTTIGRGGSDYSAAIIAEAIQANELLIYTDVSGVYTTDPNIVSKAKLINELNFQEMAEMANFGAKILHPATVEPCIRANIPIRIISTFNSEDKGTLIDFLKITDEERTTKIKAITIRKNQILVTIQSSKMLNAYGYVANIFRVLAKYKLSIDIIATSEVRVSLTINEIGLGSHGNNPFLKNESLMNELKQFAKVYVENDLTLISIIGTNLISPGIVQNILNIIKGYKIRLICYGASSSNIGILIDKNYDEKVLKLLHKKLIG
jgi:aspartate kinase